MHPLAMYGGAIAENPPEAQTVDSLEVWCEGEGGVLGHPRVYLHIERELGSIVCPYCSRAFVLREGAQTGGH